MTFEQVDRRHNRNRTTMRLAAALMLGTAASAIAITPAHAQTVDASLRGTIRTDNVAITQVTAVEVNTGYRQNASIAGNSYNFASLRSGTYRLEITLADGLRQTDQFTLSVAQRAALDFDFTAGGVDSASADGADTTTADLGQEEGSVVVIGNRIRGMEGGEVGTTISQRLIEQLPQNNRNFLAFADLAPGVQFVEDAVSGQSRLQGGAQNSRTVNVFIDGVGQKDYVLKNGITGQDSSAGNPFPQLAIGEYRVISSNYKAEFDQVSSVAITAVTKSGTNRFEGSGFIDFTNQDLRAARPQELFPTNPSGIIESRDLQFGGSLGGPIIRDTLHFFATYEGKRRIFPRDIFPGLSLPVSFFPAEYQGVFGSASQTFNEDLYFGKLTFAPTSRDLFEVSAKYRDESGEGFGSGSNAFETRTNTLVKEWRGLARWQHTADNWVNDFKVSYEDVTWGPSPVTNAPRQFFRTRIQNPNGSFSVGDVLSVGGGTNFQDKGQTGWTVGNDFTYTGLEGHTFKVGVKAKWVELNSLQLNSANPTLRYFTPLGGTFNDTTPYQLVFQDLADGDPEIRSKNFQFGIYVQDDWVVTDRLTLNLGLRWDYEETPAYLNYVHSAAQVAAVSAAAYPNLNNANYDINDYISTGNEREAFLGAWQPRLGFSYQLDERGRFVLFGGYGRSYDRNQFDFIQQELAQGIGSSRTFNFFNAPNENTPCSPSSTCIAWDPIYLTPEGRSTLLSTLPPGAARELRFIRNDLKIPYSDQFSLGLRTRFDMVELETGYSYVTSKDGFAYLNGRRRPDGSFFGVNPTTGGPQTPGAAFNPPNFSALLLGDSGLETRAHSAYLKMVKRYTAASPWSLDATYTWTRAEENRTFNEYFSLDFPSVEDYPFARSTGVRTHRFVMAGSVDIPYGIALSGKFQIASPRWLKSLVSTPGASEFEVIAVEADSNGDRWGYRQLDLAVTKNIDLPFLTDRTRVWVRADIINLMNDRNYNSFNATTGIRNRNAFGTDGPPRTIKLSTGFNF